MTERKQLTLKVTYPASTSVERLCEVLGDALYRADINLFQPMPAEHENDSNHWDYDNIDAQWTIVEIADE